MSSLPLIDERLLPGDSPRSCFPGSLIIESNGGRREIQPGIPFKLNLKVYAGMARYQRFTSQIFFLRQAGSAFGSMSFLPLTSAVSPTLGALGRPSLHGADFNPPLFYLLTRTAQGLFGEGLDCDATTRDREGVWLFGVCLFLFVASAPALSPASSRGLFRFSHWRSIMRTKGERTESCWDGVG